MAKQKDSRALVIESIDEQDYVIGLLPRFRGNKNLELMDIHTRKGEG